MFSLLSILFMIPSISNAEDSKDRATAVFAGGCFWCMEPAFEKIPGVYTVLSGYAGGSKENADYKKVSAGRTRHAEVVEVSYRPSKVSYQKLLDVFWRNIDPTTPNRQFCDAGSQYRSAIFYNNEQEAKLARESMAKIAKDYNIVVVTEIVPLDKFYPAEDYHQDFYKKNTLRYQTYRMGCGRDRRLEELWGGEK